MEDINQFIIKSLHLKTMDRRDSSQDGEPVKTPINQLLAYTNVAKKIEHMKGAKVEDSFKNPYMKTNFKNDKLNRSSHIKIAQPG